MIDPGPGLIEHRDLRIGPLLAEGGEGRVFELVDQPGVLLKAFRRPAALAPLLGLVAWPAAVETRSPELARRVAAGAAWPSAVVVDAGSGLRRGAASRVAPSPSAAKAWSAGAGGNPGARRNPGAGRPAAQATVVGDGRPAGPSSVVGDGRPAGPSSVVGDGRPGGPSSVVGDGRPGGPATVLGAGDIWPEGGTAAGLLLPRAPRRFSLRHRGGDTHLATLSYLTAAPGQRAAAYGLSLPPPFAVDRIGIVYALARLLEALQSATPSIGHGDLSTKNVLWSLERGPEVFILDCDSAERYDAAGARIDAEHRRRAMTPNWDDPAVPPGANPSPESDRYSLALIFLRVTAAAHFPIQGRQRRGEPLHIDFELPPWAVRARSLDANAAIWDLCERSLGVARPEDRPPAASWAAALEQILDDLGAMRTVRAVWAAQGGGTPGPTPPTPRAPEQRDPDVRVRPVIAEPRSQQWRRVTPGATSVAAGGVRQGGLRQGAPGTGLAPLRPAGVSAAAVQRPAGPVPVAGPSVGTQFKDGARRAASAWLRLHRRMIRSLATSGSRGVGAARLLACGALDLFLALWAVFLLGAVAAAFLKL